MEGKNVSLEEQKKFLEQKLSEEEIAQVFKRIGSKTATARIAQTDGHFQPAAAAMHQVNGGGGNGGNGASLATVASVAIIASLGLTYILDKYKDKQDKNLREELKDRIKEQLQDSKDKL